MSSQTRLWAAAGIIAIVIFGGFALSVPHTRDLPIERISTQETITPSVSIRDTYRRGVHTITGSILAPDACTGVSAAASLVGEEDSQEILIAVDMPASEGICLKEPTKESFSVTITAPENLPINATVNGSPVSITES